MTAPQYSAAPCVLVFSEDNDVVLQLLRVGRQLADQCVGSLVAVNVGPKNVDAAEDYITRGADSVLFLRPNQTGGLGVELLVDAVYQGIRLMSPAVILVGATRVGTELAARLAQRLAVPCAAGCMTLSLGVAGGLVVERYVYGGRFIAREELRSAPLMATVQMKRFEAAERDKGRVGEVRELALELPAPKVRLVATRERTRSEVDITRAEMIVAAGRGLRNLEALAILKTLAELLGAELAGSRPLTSELEWLPTDRRVGLSGQTVKPRLYVACGISGQIEHIVGMRSSRTVVAINNDPEAPIHDEADYSIVGDLHEVVPALIRACKERHRQKV